jgi:cation diffusion facilitator family transporter
MSAPLPPEISADYTAQRHAMMVSLCVGLALFGVKLTAYLMTGSAAILSDVAESVVHLPAVGIAAYCLLLSQRPADKNYLYGYERVTYFSAGLEGAMITLAALYILYVSIQRLVTGMEIEDLDRGSLLVAFAGTVNGLLGWYLIHTGRKRNSLILVADGKHVLSDSYTSFGVVAGLFLVARTGKVWLDPLIAMGVASNILYAGWRLVRESILGLMDESSPDRDEFIRGVLSKAEEGGLCTFHELRHRNTGRTTWVEVHLLFPGGTTIREAHRTATNLEEQLELALEGRIVVTTHLEPADDHPPSHPGHEMHERGKESTNSSPSAEMGGGAGI